MKTLRTKTINGTSMALIFFPEHDSALGHFADAWEVFRFNPAKKTRSRRFKSFASASSFFEKCSE